MMKNVLIVVFFCATSLIGFCQTSKALFNAGYDKWEKKEFREAINEFDRFLDRDLLDLIFEQPNFYKQALYYRGNAKLHLGQLIDAMKDFNDIIERNPEALDNSDRIIYHCALGDRGACKITLEDYRGAKNDYTKSIELSNGQYSRDFLHRAYTMFMLSDYTSAIEDLDTILESEKPRVYGDELARAYYYRGLSKIELSQQESGCLDLSRSGEQGLSKAYDAIRKFCQ